MQNYFGVPNKRRREESQSKIGLYSAFDICAKETPKKWWARKKLMKKVSADD